MLRLVWGCLLLGLAGCDAPVSVGAGSGVAGSAVVARPEAPPAGSAAAAVGSARGRCGSGMVEIEGRFCKAVMHKCIRGGRTYQGKPDGSWMPYFCDEYEEGFARCLGGEEPLHFCMDEHEFPNRKGELPVVMVSWYEAKAQCEAQGKRLCGDDEWTLACEGPERRPFAYGWARDATACNIDRPWIKPDDGALASKNPGKIQAEIERLSQRVPSGSMPRCGSPYGVMDLGGNVDEWTVNVTLGGRPFRSMFKGGHWCKGARNRCRPTTESHDETTAYYAEGFRCCADAGRAPGLLFDESVLVRQRRGVIRSVAVLLAAMQLSRPEIPKGEALRYASALNQMAQETKIDPLLAVAIVHFESRWYPSRISEDGEDYGLGQVRARFLGPCREDADPVFAPSEACLTAKATLLDGLTNIRRMGSIISANKTLCKEKAHSDKDPQWLAGYQGYNAPERNQWCKPGEKTTQVLAYHAELVEKFFPEKKAPAKSAPAKSAPAKNPAKSPAKGAPAKSPSAKDAPAKSAPPAKAPGKPSGKVGAVAVKSPAGKAAGHRR